MKILENVNEDYVWHYCAAFLGRHYCVNGVIGESLLPRPLGHPDTGVWLSSCSLPDPAIVLFDTGDLLMSLSEYEFYHGLMRFRVKPFITPTTHWFEKLSCKKWKAVYEKGQSILSNPMEWRVHHGPILRKDWLSVEVWRGNGWVVRPC